MRLLSIVAILVFLMPVFVSAQEAPNAPDKDFPHTCQYIAVDNFWYMTVPGNGMNGRGLVQHPSTWRATYNVPEHVDLIEQFGLCKVAESFLL